MRPQAYFSHLEFEPFDVRALDVIGVIAEKVRAAFQRVKVRDLYDLHRFATTPFDGELLRRLVVLKLLQTRDPFEPEALFEKIRGGDYDWADLQRLVRATIQSIRPPSSRALRRASRPGPTDRARAGGHRRRQEWLERAPGQSAAGCNQRPDCRLSPRAGCVQRLPYDTVQPQSSQSRFSGRLTTAQQPLVAAFGTPDASKAMGRDATSQQAAELALHVARVGRGAEGRGGAPRVGLGKERLQVVGHDPVQGRGLGAPRAVDDRQRCLGGAAFALVDHLDEAVDNRGHGGGGDAGNVPRSTMALLHCVQRVIADGWRRCGVGRADAGGRPAGHRGTESGAEGTESGRKGRATRADGARKSAAPPPGAP